jgi:hypothetical protein
MIFPCKIFQALLALLVLANFSAPALAQPQGLPPSLAKQVVSEIVDLSGVWSSPYGDVTLKVEGKDPEGKLIITGNWKNGTSPGVITWGRFTPTAGSGILKAEYFLPNRPMYGYVEFALQANGTDLFGKFWEGPSKGEWNLKRKPGYKPSYLSNNIPVITQNLAVRGNKVFDATGKWLSTFGDVELRGVSLTSTGVMLKGTWKNAQGQEGTISSGLFMRDPNGGILRFDYYAPWNKAQGKGEFRPDRYLGGRMLLGIYKEGNDSGAWFLCRPPDYSKK